LTYFSSFYLNCCGAAMLSISMFTKEEEKKKEGK
jgi:hypothetical protein